MPSSSWLRPNGPFDCLVRVIFLSGGLGVEVHWMHEELAEELATFLPATALRVLVEPQVAALVEHLQLVPPPAVVEAAVVVVVHPRHPIEKKHDPYFEVLHKPKSFRPNCTSKMHCNNWCKACSVVHSSRHSVS